MGDLKSFRHRRGSHWPPSLLEKKWEKSCTCCLSRIKGWSKECLCVNVCRLSVCLHAHSCKSIDTPMPEREGGDQRRSVDVSPAPPPWDTLFLELLLVEAWASCLACFWGTLHFPSCPSRPGIIDTSSQAHLYMASRDSGSDPHIYTARA